MSSKSEVVLFWVLKLKSLDNECETRLRRRKQQTEIARSLGQVRDRWPYDFLELAEQYAAQYIKEAAPGRVLGFLKELFCLVAVTQAIRYLESQDKRNGQKIAMSPVPLACYGKLSQLDNWPDMAALLAEMAEHIELASEKDLEAVDFMFAHSLREFADAIRTADHEQAEGLLEIVVR